MDLEIVLNAISQTQTSIPLIRGIWYGGRLHERRKKRLRKESVSEKEVCKSKGRWCGAAMIKLTVCVHEDVLDLVCCLINMH